MDSLENKYFDVDKEETLDTDGQCGPRSSKIIIAILIVYVVSIIVGCAMLIVSSIYETQDPAICYDEPIQIANNVETKKGD